ncbi:MAG TPA: hypothetical protein VF260_01755 [Bacilli bacterium]
MILYQMVKRMEEQMGRKQRETRKEAEKKPVRRLDKPTVEEKPELKCAAENDVELLPLSVADLLQHPPDTESREIVNS